MTRCRFNSIRKHNNAYLPSIYVFSQNWTEYHFELGQINAAIDRGEW